MARIAGINLPNEKRVEIALTYIYGIGRKLSSDTLKELGINSSTKVRDLKEDEVDKLREMVEKKLVIEGDLRRRRTQDVKRLKEIACYRGTRHKLNLPARGQRTKTNARTKRGRRVTVGSGKVKLQKT